MSKQGTSPAPLSALRDNYIWLFHKAGEAVVVDPGEAAPVLDALDTDKLRLRAILATHHHYDHVGGIRELKSRTGARVIGAAADGIDNLDEPVREKACVRIPELDMEFAVLDIPGHTAGHVAFHGQGWLFCGDTLFSAGCGRLFEGTPAEMYASLGKLAALPDETQICCGHEYTSANLRFAAAVEPGNPDIQRALEEAEACRQRGAATLPAPLGRERMINPFLRCREEPVIASAARRAGREISDPVDVFATIRAWKDSFS
jgi:hydroxyacylglutathione hydrolase